MPVSKDTDIIRAAENYFKDKMHKDKTVYPKYVKLLISISITEDKIATLQEELYRNQRELMELYLNRFKE